MADTNQPPEAKIYYGKPENQQDPIAKLVKPKTGPKKTQPATAAVLRAPAKTPPPTRLHDASHVVPKTGSPADGSLFLINSTVKEANSRTTSSRSLVSLIEISRQIYSEFITDDSHLTRALLPEYLDY
ncbi:unnamed protein product [Bemisia tabaci]|uniref:Uncharacterized protein n=1 Tax=Bemisia tabaci TaxID=7038 RepID=A0A9P0F6S0_BEMTA|nr:unnamed protein product [Bemisia tabaci]